MLFRRHRFQFLRRRRRSPHAPGPLSAWISGPAIGAAALLGAALVATLSAAPDRKYLPGGVLHFGPRDGASVAFVDALPPALRRIAPPRVRRSMNAASGGELRGERGSRVIVPPDAFVDAEGRTVRGAVDVQLEEAVAPFDYVAAGIGLEFSEGGRDFHLESAGMFRVSAEQKGRRLALAENKKITVEFPNLAPGREFSMFKLDGGGSWRRDGTSREVGTLQPFAPGAREGLQPALDSELSAYPQLRRGLRLVQAQSGPVNPANPTPFEGPPGEVGSPGDFEGGAPGGGQPGLRLTANLRVYEIDELTWWNIDKALEYVTCLKGRVEDPQGLLRDEAFSVLTIGVDHRGAIHRGGSGGAFRTIAHRGKSVKLVIAHGERIVGASDLLRTSQRKGFDGVPEGPDNFCQDIGAIAVQAAPENILEDREAFAAFLDLPAGSGE